MKNTVALMLLALSVAACTTTLEPKFPDFNQAPVRVDSRLQSGLGRIVVARNKSFVGSIVTVHISANGRPFGKVRVGQHLVSDVGPGYVLINMGTVEIDHANWINVPVRAGKTSYVLVAPGKLKILSKEDAIKHITASKQVGSADLSNMIGTERHIVKDNPGNGVWDEIAVAVLVGAAQGLSGLSASMNADGLTYVPTTPFEVPPTPNLWWSLQRQSYQDEIDDQYRSEGCVSVYC